MLSWSVSVLISSIDLSYKIMKTNLTIMILMCVYMFKLALGRDFLYYIHPRYVVFSIIATIVCSFVIFRIWRHLPEIHFYAEDRSKVLSFLIICILCVAIILPAQGLTATTALKRFNGNQGVTVRAVESQNRESGDAFSDFVFNLDNTDDIYSFQDTEVELVGFVLIDEKNTVSKYNLARFFIACCTADANPIGVPFEYFGDEYQNDDWVQIKGKIKIVTQADQKKVMLVPSSIVKVEKPEFPYAYY